LRVWDYDIDECRFREMLSCQLQIGRLDRRGETIRWIDPPQAEWSVQDLHPLGGQLLL
jgi:hypothetical protein